MRTISRTSRVFVLAAIVAATLGGPVLSSAAQAAGSAKPGPIGGKVLLQAHASFSGVDMATDAAGNTYIGWVGDAASIATRTERSTSAPSRPAAARAREGSRAPRRWASPPRATFGCW